MKREFNKILQTFGGIAGRLNTLDDFAKETSHRLHRAEKDMAEVKTTLRRLDARVGSLESRVGGLEAKVSNLDLAVTKLAKRTEERFDELLAEMRVITGAYSYHADRLDNLEKRVFRLEMRRA